jgi:predicted nuclease of predicted toxin-antitoxin system
LEDLKDILLDKGWDVSTVTEKLGSTKEARADENILKYSQETNSVVVTVDKPFVSRLRSAGVKVVALALEDKARIINEKLEKFILADIDNKNSTDDEVLDDFSKIKSGEASRMAQKSSGEYSREM